MSCNAPDVEGHISDVIHTSGVDVQTDRRAGPPPAWAVRSLRFGWFTQRTTLLIKAIHLSLCPWREMRFCLESNLTSPIIPAESQA